MDTGTPERMFRGYVRAITLPDERSTYSKFLDRLSGSPKNSRLGNGRLYTSTNHRL